MQAVEIQRKEGLKPFQLAVRGVLIRIGVEPNTELFREQLETDEKGFIAVNSQQETNVPMVFAVGDVSNPLAPTISSATGAGATAAKVIAARLNARIDMTELESEIEPAYLDAHVSAYPVEYIAGIDLYNAGEFHAAHDAWEERWMGEVGPKEKLFLQAMIQSAVAFHHLDIGRPGAARQMYLRAKEKFARLGVSVFMSLDLDEYQAQLDSALSWLLSAADPRELPMPEIVPPKIRLLATVDEFD